jgi:hypothetical protein
MEDLSESADWRASSATLRKDPAVPTLANSAKKIDDWCRGRALAEGCGSSPSGESLQVRQEETIPGVCLHGAFHRRNAGALSFNREV